MQYFFRIQVADTFANALAFAEKHPTLGRVTEAICEDTIYLNQDCEMWVTSGIVYVFFPNVEALSGETSRRGKLVILLRTEEMRECGHVWRFDV
ncbi:MAG: hypothetical protein LiPW15_481 [Parcubacteria group bacterium LiPW_15]|nr:MAG: hypothetical protein LiPW15_481 [Parcubacteria group bacterium LiPW_15]